MKKSILYGATALAIVAGGAGAEPFDFNMDDSAIEVTAMYDVDDDRDGRTDRLLLLERSDSLA